MTAVSGCQPFCNFTANHRPIVCRPLSAVEVRFGRVLPFAGLLPMVRFRGKAAGHQATCEWRLWVATCLSEHPIRLTAISVLRS